MSQVITIRCTAVILFGFGHLFFSSKAGQSARAVVKSGPTLPLSEINLAQVYQDMYHLLQYGAMLALLKVSLQW